MRKGPRLAGSFSILVLWTTFLRHVCYALKKVEKSSFSPLIHMKNLKKIAAAFSGVTAAVLPILAMAQSLPSAPFTNVAGFKTFLCTVIVGWLFTFLVVLAVIFVLVAAYKYLTAAGDPEKVKAAGNTLIYAAVAIVVALFARGLPLIVESLFAGSTGAAAVAC
jgi:hypothetical protein